MISGKVSGLFATHVGGVPKPRVDAITVQTSGILNEVIRDKKHHGGSEKAVCILSQEIIESLQVLGHPISGGSTGENILLDVPSHALQPGAQIEFDKVKLEITMAATPCKTIGESFLDQEFTLLSDKKYPSQTRWYARVITEGVIQDLESVVINSNA